MNQLTILRWCTSLVLFAVLSGSGALFAQTEANSGKPVSIPEALKQMKKSVVFIGRIDKQPGVSIPPDGFLLTNIDRQKVHFEGTGFLINVEGITHLVTAKHVVNAYQVAELRDGKVIQKIMDDDMLAFYNRKDGKVGYRSIGWARKSNGVDWIFHEDGSVDVAIVPFPTITGVDDVMTMPEDYVVGTSKLQELYEVFFIAYQPGAESVKKITPVIRGGMISLINDDKTFYFDGFAFPGNSGSPVFYKPSVSRYGEKEGFEIGNDTLAAKFIGIVGEYLPYQEVAVSVQTRRPRIIFEEHTGLSRVWSADFLTEIEKSSLFRAQLKRLLDKTKQK